MKRLQYGPASALLLLLGAAAAVEMPGPVRGPELVLWLDADDVDGDGDAANNPAAGSRVSHWNDKSGAGHHASQSISDQQPTLHCSDGLPGRCTIRFDADARHYLCIKTTDSLDVAQMSVFVVARASARPHNMWLLGKNVFAGPWSGYGVAVNGASVAPWPHLGLGHTGPGGNGYVAFSRRLDAALSLVEVTYDGRRLYGRLNGQTNAVHPAVGSIVANDRNLLIGASPQNPPATEFLDGEIAEMLVYNRPLDADERQRTNAYLAAKHGLALEQDDTAMIVIQNGYLPLIVENATTPATRTLDAAAADAVLRRDWLFQAAGTDLGQRALAEIAWTRQLAARLARAAGMDAKSAEWTELEAFEQALQAQPTADVAASLYIDVRRVKRRLMLSSKAVDFSQLLLIDQPYPQGPEARHEAMHRLGLTAVPGGRLLVLDGLHPGGRVRSLGPDRPGAYWRADLSFDATRVLFCYKAHDDESFNLFEVNLDGSGLRQLTDSVYDDIDPIYLPDGLIAFTTTRGNTYVRCGPYIPSYVLARCNADGSDPYVVSQNSEPDFLPALLNDGRIVYSRWEYSDKDQNRVQSLWTTNQDGTQTAVLWGNQSVWPDHLAEPRPIPGSNRVMFSGVGHHNWFTGSIGIIDPRKGLNYPLGLTRVTCDLPWAEVNNPPIDRAESDAYHASGAFSGYMGPYPLSAAEFLVSACGTDLKFRLYLMDVYGNRELLYEGANNAWYAIPVRPRTPPLEQPDGVTWPGTGSARQDVEPGVFYNPDVYEGVPELVRGSVRYLRVLQQDAKTYSTWVKTFVFSGPAISAVQTEAVKRIVSVVPVEADGSVYFHAPAGRALYFQLLDEHYRALHTMRSFTGVLPGERRACTGCHESRHTAPAGRPFGTALGRPATDLTLPPWGQESIGFERFVQPVLDRYCGACHQGDGEARKTFDMTLRPATGPFKDYPFTEPYLTLVGPASWPVAVPDEGQAGYGFAGLFPVYGLGQEDTASGVGTGPGNPVAVTLATLLPGRALSVNSPLIRRAMGGEHHGVTVDPLSLRRLIAWVDANGPYRGDEEVRALADPAFAGIEELPVTPRVRTAPVVSRP